MNFDELYLIAHSLISPRKISSTVKVGMVSCALETVSGHIFTGICAEISCSLGYCAEEAAISAMLTAGENRISKIITVYRDGTIIPPCGKCRELMFHLSDNSFEETQVMIDKDVIIPLKDIMPKAWYSMIRKTREENIKRMGSDYV